MRISSLARHHARLLAVAGLFILVAAIFLSLRYGRGGDRQKDAGPALDGRQLTYLDFDRDNRKSLTIQCRESRRLSNERLLMKGISATFFASARLEKDIQVSGDSGIASRNLYDFDIRGRARVYSSEFSMDGPRFFLENREKLSSRDAVSFALKDVSGRAAAGMEYYINLSVLKLFQCQGRMVRDGQPFDFRARTFWVIKKDHLLVLEKEGELIGAGATARSDWMSLQFDPEFVHLRSMTNIGHCFYSMAEKGEDGRPRLREITAGYIRIDYDAQGRPREITVHGAGKISLQDPRNNCQIAAEITQIFLRSDTQTLEKVQTLTRGTLSSRGQDNLTVSGDTLSAFYTAAGQLLEMKAKRNCEFRSDEFRGTAAALNYDAPLFLVEIMGRDATVVSRKSTFTSSHFKIHSKQQLLSADKDVKATVVPEGKSVLLSGKPLFIVATAMEMTRRGDIIRFRDKVKLFQEDVEIHAGEMIFENANNRMICRTDAELKFVSENEPVELRGQAIVFNHAERTAVISGNASLAQAGNVLGGRQIELDFDPNNRLESILARDNVVFNRDNLSARSGTLHWQYRKKIIWFRDSAQITRKDAGTTKGRELILNLDTNEITVSSREDRAETIIRTDRP